MKSFPFLLTFLLCFPFPLLAGEVEAVFHLSDGTQLARTVPLTVQGSTEFLEISPDFVPEKTVKVEVHHPAASAKVGEPGFYVLCNGLYGEFLPREKDLAYTNSNVTMATFGVKTPRAALAVILSGMALESSQCVTFRDGIYEIFPVFTLDEEKPYEPIRVEFHHLAPGASYPEMAREYRKYQLDRGACRPLKDRMAERPELAQAANSVEVRVRLGWKPVPSPVGEQTAENEPEMHAAVSFARCRDIMEEFQKQGVKNAEFCLVGWNIGGHDGRFPQLFPVEPRLGGEAELRKTIRKAREMNFLIVGHTSESGAYSVSALGNRWSRDYLLVRKKEGIISYRTWGGGNVYHTCPKAVYERFADEDYAALKDLGFRGLHYIDVYSTVNARTCVSPEHPLTKAGFSEWVDRLFLKAQTAIGGVGSEGGFDHCIKNLDYGLYISFVDPAHSVLAEARQAQPETSDAKQRPDRKYVPEGKLPPLCDRHVPYWELVYHGILLYNPYTATVNYTLKDPICRLKLVEFGGRPLFYFYQSFLSTGTSWMGNADLHCATDEELTQAVAAIKKGADEYETLKRLQTEFMENHERLAPNVFRTTYSDGTWIVTNYTDEPFVFEGRTVGPLDYILGKTVPVQNQN